ncbi:hypothetical protein GOBAR_AA17775 [Gossypium barbadense]|uniref:RING-type domain-containing protein n=1 Tax=Gossypium barbadense TaxID=3634 RepID=A0A2P5XHQ0_GOSBA|nr:hypothetical protein GOBAR_AA17775 [Gossypium barbadense]
MAQITPSSDLDFVDDFYYSALFDEDEHEIFPPSDDKYAEELQFQEALMSSTVFSEMGNNDICNPCIAHASSPLLIQGLPQPELLEMETEESGESSLSFCEICVERKENDQMFTTQSCNHSYCSDCISKHVSTRVEENLTVVRCPGVHCETVLELDECRPLLPEVCYVPWHPGITCEDFQRLNEDERGREDLMVRELAQEKKWARCPKCKYYVERTVGVSSSFVMVVEKSGVTLMVAAKGIKNTITQQYHSIEPYELYPRSFMKEKALETVLTEAGKYSYTEKNSSFFAAEVPLCANIVPILHIGISLPLREGNQFFSKHYEVSVYYLSRTSIQYHGYAFVIDLHRHRVNVLHENQ